MRLIQRNSVCVMYLCATLAGCAEESAQPDENVHSSDQMLAVPTDWVGYPLGLAPPLARDVRPLDFNGAGATATSGLLGFDLVRKVRYRVDFDRSSLDALGARMRELTATQTAPEVTPEPPSSLEKGLILPDERQRFAVADGFAKDNYPLRTIGMVKPSGCTGTLIAERLVLTAAHCVLNNSNQVNTTAFDPRLDGTNPNRFLNPESPWGTWPVVQTFVSQEFINRDCLHLPANSPDVECFGADFAILVVNQPAGFNHPGAMCFAWHSDKNVLNSYILSTLGYPACGTPISPANCTPNTLYGDVRDCQLGASLSFDTQGQLRATDFDCDISAGQSGSPILLNRPTWLPNCTATVIGVASGNRVFNNGTTLRNVMRNMTPELANAILFLDSLF